MAKAHFIVPTVPTRPPLTARLGTQGAANNFSDVDQGKFVKLIGESAYGLSVAGEDIDGVITSVESAPSNGFSVGGVQHAVPGDVMWATADGLQATPGTGMLVIGDIVNVGTVVARGTALPRWPRVTKATTAANVIAKWRVVSLGSAGTGAVGTDIVIQRV